MAIYEIKKRQQRNAVFMDRFMDCDLGLLVLINARYFMQPEQAEHSA